VGASKPSSGWAETRSEEAPRTERFPAKRASLPFDTCGLRTRNGPSAPESLQNGMESFPGGNNRRVDLRPSPDWMELASPGFSACSLHRQANRVCRPNSVLRTLMQWNLRPPIIETRNAIPTAHFSDNSNFFQDDKSRSGGVLLLVFEVNTTQTS
jgi:hypothetical protein